MTDGVRRLRVVVTGGRGFVGSHLMSGLRGAGHWVSALDLVDGLDVCDPAAVWSALAEADVVVHLAAWADLYEARRDPVEAVRVNVLGTATVANVARLRGIRLVHGSTACVYGNQETYPTPENAVPNPTEIYAQTKLAAEQVVQGLVASFGLDAVCVRFPGVYGEGLRGALAVARFFECAMSNGELEVHGDGLQTRTPIHVEDLVRGLLRVVESPDIRGVINLGTSEEISALDLARRIREIVGRGRIVHVGQRLPQTHRELVDWTRARTLLGWEPQVTLREGLERTWRWWCMRGEHASGGRSEGPGNPHEQEGSHVWAD